MELKPLSTEWTVDTLKEYFEARLYANETAIEAAKTGSDAAITAAKESTEIALYAEKQNRDVALGIARDAAFKAIDAARDSLTDRLNNGDEKLLVHIDAQKESTISALDSLKDLLAEKDKATDMADRKQSEALAQGNKQLDRRLDDINHSRALALAERSSLIHRDVHDGAVTELRQQINGNREAINERLLKETYETTVLEWNKWRTEINEFKTAVASRGEGVSSTAKAGMYALTAVSILVAMFSAITSWSNDPKDAAAQARYNAGRLDSLERQTAPAAPVTVTNPTDKPVPTQQRP